MSENNSSISTREAAEITGFSARHIQGMIKKGKLSASRDDGGNYIIDKSEFYRVFPDAHSKQNEFLHKQLETATAGENNATRNAQ